MKATYLTMTSARRAAVALAMCCLGALPLGACVTTVNGSADYAAGSPIATASTSADPATEMKKQCASALTTAKGFLESWKNLASSGITPSAEQRTQLATEVQGYIDQLNAQLPTIADTTLVSLLQAVVAEMTKIVEGLKSGIAVELTSYRTAINTATDYCQ